MYQSVPDWVKQVDLSGLERDSSKTVVVSDTQIRIEEGKRWEYKDSVIRILGSNQLTKAGTVKAVWYPDKGDLIIHDVAILRDGEEIDVVASGERFEVLRRERQLEQAIVDGSLTATLFVPGLQIGDELRVAYSTTLSDQALNKEVQSQTYLWREPNKTADLARVLVSWPEDLEVRHKAWPQVDQVTAETKGGFDWLKVDLPLPEADEVPDDAPARYRQSTVLQLGTFADWAEVSATMAPHYQITGALEGLDDLQARADAIGTQYDSQLEQAVAALDLVQSEVRYLLNGLNGGNYIPQSVATTWDKKYGDCKAKTLILLALLDHLGIEAEAVLVDVDSGDAVQASLPLPGAFDHVLVRATIDGQLYYLDGTSSGAHIDLVGNVPGFHFALPINDAGAKLEPIVQVLPRVAEMTMHIEMDASAGADLPSLGTLEMRLLGPSAARINAFADKMTDEIKRQMARRISEDMDLVDVDVVKGKTTGDAVIILRGIVPAAFNFESGRGEFGGEESGSDEQFSPNRSRRDWRDIPVAVDGPGASVVSLNVTLPGDPSGYEIVGEEQFSAEVAGRLINRKASLVGNLFSLEQGFVTKGGEIAPENVRQERRKSMVIARNELKLLAPEDTPRVWRFAQGKDRSALAALETAYAKVIESDPDEASPYLSRAAFRYDTYDFSGSLADMDKVVAIDGTAQNYEERSTVHMQLLDPEAALADLEEAYALEPSPSRAMDLASHLLDMQDAKAAREAIEYEDGDKDVRQSLAYWMAHIDGFEGKKEDGLARYDELLADDPNDSSLMNNKCWFMGVWQVALDQVESVCKRAVEINGTAGALDSRAMAYYRLGRFEEALGDLNEALELQPNMIGSLLLRGFVRMEMGDKQGKADVTEALARSPSSAAQYRKWGFDL